MCEGTAGEGAMVCTVRFARVCGYEDVRANACISAGLCEYMLTVRL